jgi:hypothetical protein
MLSFPLQSGCTCARHRVISGRRERSFDGLSMVSFWRSAQEADGGVRGHIQTCSFRHTRRLARISSPTPTVL